MKRFFFLVILILLVRELFGQQRTVTLSVPPPPAFEFKEAYLFTDSAEVKVGNARVWFKPLRGRSVLATVHGKGKIFEDGFSSQKGGGADIIREKTDRQVKETVVIRDTAITDFKFQIKSNTGFRRVRDYIALDAIGHIEPPRAWDANNKAVGAWFTLSGDTLTYYWDRTDTSNFTYPLYIDPTVTIQPGTWGIDFYIRSDVPTTNFGGAEMQLGSSSRRQDYFKFDSIYEYANGYTVDSAIFSFHIGGIGGTGVQIAGGLRIGFNQDTISETGTVWNTKPPRDTSSAMVPDSQYFALSFRGWANWNVTTYADSVANKGKRDSGIVVRATLETAAGFYTDYAISSDSTTERPKLVLYLTVITAPSNVYAADSLAFSTLTDSSAKLDSIAGNPLDASTGNVFAIYDTSIGMYMDTTQTAPFKKAKTTYVKSAWKNKVYPFPRNYITRFKVMSYASNGTDSLKITTYNKTIGTPGTTGTRTKGIIPDVSSDGVIIDVSN